MVRVLRPGRVLGPLVPRATRAVRRVAIGRGRGAVWQSTYYTRPPRWDGAEVVWVYDMIHERFADQYTRDRDDELRAAKREAVDHADAIIAISRATAADLQEVYDLDLSDRLHVVPLAPATLPDGPPLSLGEPYLLHVGGRAGYKGFLALLEAYASWPGRHEIRLVTAGRPWTDDEDRAITALGLTGRVGVTVEPDDHHLAALYRGAAALVHPSAAEGFGLPVLEAMAVGCPVVATRLRVTEEVGGDLPFWFDAGDGDGLRHALDLALAGDEARRSAGQERAAGYTWDRTAAAALEVLVSLS